jgi:hypothetical protein
VTPAERYIVLALRLDRHVEGVVDAYYGPPELAAQVAAEEVVAAAELAVESADLEAGLEDGWFRDCVHGLTTYSRVLAGDSDLSYSDEIEGCFGVRPERTDESVYQAALEELDRLLPGDGTLAERREAWRRANLVPADDLTPLLHDVLDELRRRTQILFGLPEGESITLEEVSDKPWAAFNNYLGNGRSHVEINLDIPMTFDLVLELAAHEAYPGHHTERATKEVALVEERGQLEETIVVIPTPQSLLAEGIAETAREVVDAEDALRAIVRKHGHDPDFELAAAIARASRPLRSLSVNGGLLMHEDGASEEEALQYGMRWGALTEERARQGVRFIADPTWRAYSICYSAGGDLARRFHQNDPARFKRLLSENVRISELGSS